MELASKKSGDSLTVSMTGELDHHSAGEVRRKIDELLGDQRIKKLVLDMRGVTFMDSSGLGVVLGRYRQMTERLGSMQIRGASKCCERIMKMAGIYSLVEQEVRGGALDV